MLSVSGWSCQLCIVPSGGVRVQVVEAEERGELVFAYLAAAVAFGLGIWAVLGAEKAQEYFAGYLLEQSLSVDNLFVFILVFQYFRTPRPEQDKVSLLGLPAYRGACFCCCPSHKRSLLCTGAYVWHT